MPHTVTIEITYEEVVTEDTVAILVEDQVTYSGVTQVRGWITDTPETITTATP